MDQVIQVITTIDGKEAATAIARSLVERRVAGCVQVVGPITSTYWWQGAIETAEEWLCLIKTRQDLYAQVERTIRELHSYDVPEILAMPIFTGYQPYLDWVKREAQPTT
jgi:periplasmic divalent cation tolerance protein